MAPQGPGRSSELLLEVVKILDQQKIPYAVIGAFAVAYYGVVRASLDIDALIAIDKDAKSINEFMTALADVQAQAWLREADDEDPVRGVIVVEDCYGNRVDLLLGIKNFDSSALERASSIQFAGKQLRIIGLEDLIIMKLLAGGVQDLEDARGVLTVSADRLDLRSLRKRAADTTQECLANLELLLKE